MRLAFLGTPDAAVPFLQALVDDGHDVALVVSQPDRRRGRGGEVSPSPVKSAALDLGCPVSDQVDDVLGRQAELGVVVAFGRLIKPHVLDQVPMVNVHFSMLPRWRGAAPVERAILAGDAETGVCLMQLEAGLDTGPVHAARATPVDADESAAELRHRLAEIGVDLLRQSLRRGLAERPVPQQGEPTYAAKIDPAELRLDWSQPAEQLERVVRVGGAWTTWAGKRLKVHRACAHRITGQGIVVEGGDGQPLELLSVQPEGRAAMTALDWARGARWQPGRRFGS